MYSLLGIQSVADVVRHGRLRWIGYLERETEEDWVSAHRHMEVVGQNVGIVGAGKLGKNV